MASVHKHMVDIAEVAKQLSTGCRDVTADTEAQLQHAMAELQANKEQAQRALAELENM